MKKTKKMNLINNLKAVIAFLVGIFLVIFYVTKVLPFGIELDPFKHPLISIFLGYIGFFVTPILITYGLYKFIGMERWEKMIDKMM